ncbi:hypothetical protein [Niallia endozanthoxylica]|uniref:Uncharacterized protein n=1 Tax=Niallia endozanthoxylica TaxID=2036016 RepID=A0A5J5HNS8_9BACI|nr:hypothetical protein [Niallia endozanthoxylica]KAA9022307.1 hypothetical protein F4V44_15690 [Niallia endozanthoxylica]
MNPEQREAIYEFFKVTKKLKDLDIVRSSSYLGNIAEFVCSNLYGITLSESQREESLDGVDINGIKVEIKSHDGESGNNIVMSKYKDGQNFKDLIVFLAPSSKIRPNNIPQNTFAIYRIRNYNVNTHGNIAKGVLGENGYDFLLDEHLNILEDHI